MDIVPHIRIPTAFDRPCERLVIKRIGFPLKPNQAWDGITECNHSHWRWASVTPSNFGSGRILGIPNDSKQNLDFAVVRYHSGEEDPIDFKTLTEPDEPLRTHNTAGRDPLQIFQGTAPEEVVLWYSGTSQSNTDTFLGHGGFFNPTLSSKQLYSNAPTQDGIGRIVASQIYDAGSTNIAPFDATVAGPLPTGYTQYGTLSYDITTTAVASGGFVSRS